MFCKSCGKEIPDNSVNCPNCGTTSNNNLDSGSPGWFFLGCCIPIVGIILYFVWKGEKPLSAKKCLIGFITGIVLSILFYIVYMFLIVGLITGGIY